MSEIDKEIHLREFKIKQVYIRWMV